MQRETFFISIPSVANAHPSWPLRDLSSLSGRRPYVREEWLIDSSDDH